MALKATINKISAFDAAKEYTFEFTYQGNQPYINELSIYEKDTNKLVYNDFMETMLLSHTLPANTLSNNGSYYATVILYDINSAASVLSDKFYFNCYTTPALSLLNINSDGTSKITSSNYEMQVKYSQKENRALKEYIFNVYDSRSYNLVYQSGTKRYSDDMNNIINCAVKGLENNCIYYFQFTGITVDNVEISIPRTAFYVSYRKAASYSVLNMECDKNAGYMKYNTYIVIVEGTAAGTYNLDDGRLEIVDGEIYYYSGFLISGDFVIGIKYTNGTTIKLSNGLDNIILTQNRYDDKEYYKLEATNTGLPSMILYSDLYERNNDTRTVYIKRKGGLYDLSVVIA